MSNVKQQTQEIQFQTPFDVIPLPSKGLLYPGQNGNVKVEYMTAMDENILTSPNLIKSGKVIDVLMERKIKEAPVPFEQLLVGDRNAIMIWLRATGYGEIYPVKLTDPNSGVEFEYEVDLSQLKSKPLLDGIEPDENGEFSFELPRSKKMIKFKLLTVGDEKSIASKTEKYEKATKSQISNTLTYRLQTQIKEVDGNRDINFIQQFINVMPAYDSLKFREYSDKIEPGIDMSVEVEGPTGTFQAPITIGLNFFWPNVRI
jgi:hypothetical protein